MVELILFTIIILAVIGFSGFQFYMNHKHIQKLEEMLMSGNIHTYKEVSGKTPVGAANEIKAEPNEILSEGMGDFDISKVANLQVDNLPPRKVKIYS